MSHAPGFSLCKQERETETFSAVSVALQRRLSKAATITRVAGQAGVPGRHAAGTTLVLHGATVKGRVHVGPYYCNCLAQMANLRRGGL